MLLLTLRGTPTMYYGDELGMEDVPIAPDQVQGPGGEERAGQGARAGSGAGADDVGECAECGLYGAGRDAVAAD